MKPITKKVQRSEELFIQFTPEELQQLNLKEGDKFSWKIEDEGLLLQKYGSIDIDLADFSRETLEMLVTLSIEKDITVSEVIEEIIRNVVEEDKHGR